MNKKIGLVWLHNDLRVHDNKTIANAAKHCDVLLLLYATYDFPTSRGQAYHFNAISKHRHRFLHETLSDLALTIRQLGNALLFIEHANLSQLVELLVSHHITDIFYSHTVDYDQQLRHTLVKQQLPQLLWHESVSATLFDDLPMPSLPKMFTSFRKAIEKNMDLLHQPLNMRQTSIPEKLPPMPTSINHSILYMAHPVKPQSSAFIGGETQALAHLAHYFSSDAPCQYKRTRNTLDNWSDSTKFSAWLSNGSLSVRVLLNTLRDYEKHIVANESTYWIWFELLWREYFHWYADTHQHKLFIFKGISQSKKISCFYGERFERWRNGNLPYPIVNACMNQLYETGYLSNRGRQIVASCFIHELGIDWRYGASYFEQQLIDYDVANNWGNWQYLAGVGADPRGSRQFSLDKQTQQYDPDGLFIQQWHGDVEVTSLDSVDMADWPIG